MQRQYFFIVLFFIAIFRKNCTIKVHKLPILDLLLLSVDSQIFDKAALREYLSSTESCNSSYKVKKISKANLEYPIWLILKKYL